MVSAVAHDVQLQARACVPRRQHFQQGVAVHHRAARGADEHIDLLKGARPNDAPPRLVINQIGIPKRPEIPTKDFAETMGVEPSALIAFEPTLFGQSANNGQMVIETSAKAPVAEAMRQLCRAITGRSLQGAGAKNTSSIFSFFKKRA